MITVTGWRHRRFAQGTGQGFERWVWGVEVTIEYHLRDLTDPNDRGTDETVMMRLVPSEDGELRCPGVREDRANVGVWVTTPDDVMLDHVTLAVMEVKARIHVRDTWTPPPARQEGR